jgi:hypothetical protein
METTADFITFFSGLHEESQYNESVLTSDPIIIFVEELALLHFGSGINCFLH